MNVSRAFVGAHARSALLAALLWLAAAGVDRSVAETPDGPPELARAEQPAGKPDAAARGGLLEWDRMTGNWGGGRTWLEEHGVTVDLGLTTIYQHNARGGVRTGGAQRVSGSYDFELILDTGGLSLWRGGMLYALARGSWDEGISKVGYVGDSFGVNGDAEGDRAGNVTALWYEQRFWGDRVRVRLGKLALSVDFETNAYANDETAQFMNNGLINAGNVPFPGVGQGIQFVATPCSWFYFGAGVTDAEANTRQTGFGTAYHGRDDFFSIYEFGVTPEFKSARGPLAGSYRFGLWYDPQPKEMFFDDLGGRRRTIPMKRDDMGFYTSCDQLVWRERVGEEGDEQGLGLFFRYAYARADVNEIEHFWSCGAQYLGLIPTRDEDVLGFGVAQGILSKNLRLVDADPHRETVLEAYYSLQLAPWLTISPDVQWILRPGGEDGRDAFVMGVRVQMAF